jgi:CysZ protein
MFKSFTYYLKAIQVFWSAKKLKRFAIIPILLNILIYSFIVSGTFTFLWDWSPNIPATGIDGIIGTWIDQSIMILASILKWILGIPLLFIICYLSFIMSYMLIASPFNDILSEKTELHVKGIDLENTNISQGLKHTLKSFGFTLDILMRQLFWTLLALPLLIIPYVGFIPLLCITAYFTGIGFYDIPMSRHGYKNKEKKDRCKENRGKIFALGFIAELSFLIPGLALFTLPLGVIAGTLLYCDE